MENQKLLDLETNLTENDQKTIFSDTDDGALSEGLKHKYENAIDDDLINVPEKVVNAEKIGSLENTFEVIDQESKTIHDVQEEAEDKNISDEEKDNLFENDPVSNTKIEDITNLPNIESPKAEEPGFSEKLESMTTDNTKPVIIQENEPVNTVHSKVKISETPEVISTVSTKKDTDEGDVCDIKIGPDELFCRIGLDKWFNPEKLPPKVEALVYWRDPISSGIVFGATLVVLLSFAYMSLISVVAYLAMFIQSACILLRLYKTALQTVNKTNESHPFQEYLDLDIRLPQEKAEEVSKLAVVHVNAVLVELRRLLLAEDLVDSAKFFGILWVLTYVGALFNGLTLIIIGFVALFTLPKVYENNKTQIDQNIEVVRSKIAELTNKVRAAIPIGKKNPETKKKE
ncbi:reticulon 1 isoform 1 [Acyrthosiphon pisum]|uniref:Reticulon-like protein n=1 Tax=Acyrthosiphon pisum TaxID=7029 RepID=A0A8R1TGQ8_ACYPI|nr:reticulon 1 isoform 1 [Acyrthosiphon pisum]|eukprot:NP_001191909.1 reticulon 1 isoform 1 [Acyrthosiphon pisum]